MKKKILIYSIATVAMLVLFFVAMVLVYCIPVSWLSKNVSESLKVIDSEGTYPTFFFGVLGSRLDNYTDRAMINMNNASLTGNPFYQAMNNNGYARYWHGYQVFLRPLLIFFDIRGIRYLGIFVFLILFCAVFAMLCKRVNVGVALAFLITIASFCIVVIPVSLQFSSVFNITFLFMLYLLCFKDITKAKYVPLAFMIVGMLTSFIDLLTVPLLTLGLPLILYILLNIRNGKDDWWENFKLLIIVCLLWCFGYGFCWFFKWVIASIFTKRNIIQNAIDQIFFRTMGNEKYPVTRMGTLKKNVETLFELGESLPIVLAMVLGGLSILALIFRTTWKRVGLATLFLGIAIFPYVWYFVLANHSNIHAWFTYRLQGMTVFALLTGLILLIDWQKIGQVCQKVKSKGMELYVKILQKK
ncbi:MAG: hypothetical protein IJX49_04105 [Clostridia bacterium]|nr:hypothetical protein [Clostridia bacterium]